MNTSDKARILMIGAGWEQLALVETIKKQGHYLVATHPSIQGEGLKIADQYYVKDSRDVAGHISIAQSHRVNAIITDNCDYSFYSASIVAAKLGLPFASIQSALYSNDKYAQRVCVSQTTVKQPIFVKIQTIEQLYAAIAKIGFPSILKPVDSRGTFGVTIIGNIETLETAYFDAISNSPSRTLIYEQFITGTLVTVDGLCFSNGHQSLTVASRKFDSGPKPVTKEIIYPALFDSSVNNALMQTHHTVATALNYQYGHTHGEYLLTPNNQIYLVECTNRGGGVYTSSVIVPLLTGLPTNEILLNQSLGTDTYITDNKGFDFMKCSVMLTFLDYEVGKVIDAINTDEMKQKPYTVRFRSKYGINDMVESIENGAGRHSMLVIGGKNTNDVMNNLQSFKETFKIIYHK
ncbi:MAG: ATP-grasp domain-containing protein [Cytophagales bacterium]|nr:ATP-grasp domain-containing protein [Cytophaga sp.]